MQAPSYFWQRYHPLALLLWPLSMLYALLVAVKRFGYRSGIRQPQRFAVPVIVVGNISVGGTGKTPLVIWLANHFKSLGYQPGIVMRGYGGTAEEWPQSVTAQSDPQAVGDEAVVIARRSGCPVCADPDRPNAVRYLLENSKVDLILSDDGLQHDALARDLEIVVIDGKRRFGNGFLLPAGPLRESQKSAKRADFVVINGAGEEGEMSIQQRAGDTINLLSGESRALSEWNGSQVHAIAGLGNP